MTITEVSKQYELSQDTLRYYERIGLIPDVMRIKSGIRDYKPGDLKWVEFAKCMRNAGIPIETLIEYVALFQQGEDTAEARRELLLEQRRLLSERVVEMQKTLARLDYKIERYETVLLKKEQELLGL